MLALSPHSKQIPGFCVKFACFPCVCVGVLQMLQIPPPIGKNVSEKDCYLCYLYHWDWLMVKVHPASHLKSAWIGSNIPVIHNI